MGSQRLFVKNCDNSETGSPDEEEHNVWNGMLELSAHHACSPALQRCLQGEDVCNAAHVQSLSNARGEVSGGISLEQNIVTCSVGAEGDGRGRWQLLGKGGARAMKMTST